MPDTLSSLLALRRPMLLVRAVRFALADYPRRRLLRRLVPGEERVDRIVPRLFEIEAALEEQRQSGDSAYSAARHIEALVALVGEIARLEADAAMPLLVAANA